MSRLALWWSLTKVTEDKVVVVVAVAAVKIKKACYKTNKGIRAPFNY